MGMIDRFIGVGSAARNITDAATGVVEVFRENTTRRMELDEEAYQSAVQQFSAEFAGVERGWFDNFVNGLNRLPRPFLTLGTLGLFTYAMVEPIGFSTRMVGLQTVPEPLWWLLGAIVSFYFGAREAHYFRNRTFPKRIETALVPTATTGDTARFQAGSLSAASFPDNAALRDWINEAEDAVT